jgi:hypothetical protein
MSPKPRAAAGRLSRALSSPPSSLPIPSPAMNDATMSATDTTPTPVCSVRIRCHTTW